jgi:isoprenylcysteine carboxyl methyltransferase (ICMT) family protein YpbQ
MKILALFLVTICISSIALTKKTQNSSSKSVNDSYAEAYGQANNNLYAVIFIFLFV